MRSLRLRAGLSARELDRLAWRSEGHCWTVESRGTATAATASRYARALGASLDWLVDGRGRAPTDAEIAAALEAARRA